MEQKEWLCEPSTRCPRCGSDLERIQDGKWYVDACMDDGCGWIFGGQEPMDPDYENRRREDR